MCVVNLDIVSGPEATTVDEAIQDQCIERRAGPERM